MIAKIDYDDRMEVYDGGAFTLFKSQYGTYNSRDRDGNSLCCGINKDSVIFWSREHLNGFQNSSYTVVHKISDYKL